MASKTKTYTSGDKVAYSAAFLRSTGQYTGDIPFLRGEIVAVEPLGERQLCTIQWSLDGKPVRMPSQYHDDGLGRVISPNLTLVSRLALDAA